MSNAARKISPITFDEIETALDEGRVEMMRPWGDWVPVRRRAPTVKRESGHRSIPVWLENQVEGAISTYGAATSFADVRIAE